MFGSYFRLILTAIEIDSTFLFSNKNAGFFNNFMGYMMQHLDTNIDANTKKTILHILKELFIDFSGLTNQ